MCRVVGWIHLLLQDVSALHGGDTGAVHFRDGILHIIGLEVDSPAGVLDEVRFEAQLGRIQRCELHAVIRGQAAYENFRDALAP